MDGDGVSKVTALLGYAMDGAGISKATALLGMPWMALASSPCCTKTMGLAVLEA